MISRLGVGSNNYRNQPNFKGSGVIARKEMYRVTTPMTKIFQRSKFSFVETLAFVTRTSAAGLRNNKRANELNESFDLLKKASDKTSFKKNFQRFMSKNGFINEDGIFAKLPAKLLVLKEGIKDFSEDFSGKADKVVVNKGVEFFDSKFAKAKMFFIKGNTDINTDLIADTVILNKNAIVKDVYANKIRGKYFTSNNLHATKYANLKNPSINGDLDSKDIYGENILMTGCLTGTGNVVLRGARNQVNWRIYANSLDAENLKALSLVTTVKPSIITGENNYVNMLEAKDSLSAQNIKVGTWMCSEGDVFLESGVVNDYVHSKRLKVNNSKINGDLYASHGVTISNSTIIGNVSSRIGDISINNSEVKGNVAPKVGSVFLSNAKVKGELSANKLVVPKNDKSIVSGEINVGLSLMSRIRLYFNKGFGD